MIWQFIFIVLKQRSKWGKLVCAYASWGWGDVRNGGETNVIWADPKSHKGNDKKKSNVFVSYNEKRNIGIRRREPTTNDV